MSASKPAPEAVRPLRRAAAVAWLSGCVLMGLLLGQIRAQALHFQFVSFGLLVLALCGSVLFALLLGLWRTARGPQRGPAFAWMLLTVTPFTLLLIPCLMAQRTWASRRSPRTFSYELAKAVGASLMEGQAALFYPNRLETERLVMFYDRLTTPKADIEAMEKHVASLEKRLGKPLRGKIHWIRGSLLGQSGVSFYGLSLGSAESPDPKQDMAYSLDRHELAHAVIWQQMPPRADPPSFLSEGWAQAQMGYTSPQLAQLAVARLDNHTKKSLKELTSETWYHHLDNLVYDEGGAFVDYLIRYYGMERFRELYNTATPETFLNDCRRIFGVSADVLEGQFWKDARARAHK